MRPYRVGWDARMWNHPGIGRYIREMTSALAAVAQGIRFAYLAPAGFRRSCRFSGEADFIGTRSGIYGVFEQLEIPWKSRGLDLLHVPHFNVPVLYRRPLVVTVHDLIYLREPAAARSPLARHYVDFLMRRIESAASAVITVSQATRSDLLSAYSGLRPDRVFVIHEAASDNFKKMNDAEALSSARRLLSLERPFVLAVGSLKSHKNFERLLQAMDIVRAKGLPHELVLVGRRDAHNRSLDEAIARRPFVRYAGELADGDLPYLYNLADLFVMPSLREGFGLPLLEAMASGTAAVASQASSLPEILGPDGLYFDPLNVDAMSDVIYNVLQNQQLRENLARRGLARSSQFSWRQAAVETLKVYERVQRM